MTPADFTVPPDGDITLEVTFDLTSSLDQTKLISPFAVNLTLNLADRQRREFNLRGKVRQAFVVSADQVRFEEPIRVGEDIPTLNVKFTRDPEVPSPLMVAADRATVILTRLGSDASNTEIWSIRPMSSRRLGPFDFVVTATAGLPKPHPSSSRTIAVSGTFDGGVKWTPSQVLFTNQTTTNGLATELVRLESTTDATLSVIDIRSPSPAISVRRVVSGDNRASRIDLDVTGDWAHITEVPQRTTIVEVDVATSGTHEPMTVPLSITMVHFGSTPGAVQTSTPNILKD